MSSLRKNIVSLTTIPERLPFINPTLEKLLKSKADAVILNLPVWCVKTNSSYKYEDIVNITEGVVINRCDDKGPATKIIPTVEKFPEDNIFVCDDDHVYEPEMVDMFFDNLSLGKFVCGNGANTPCIIEDIINDFNLSKSQVTVLKNTTDIYHFFFPEVFAGLCFNAKLLNIAVLDRYVSLSDPCRYSDDLCIGKWFHHHNFTSSIIGFHKVDRMMENKNNYGRPDLSLAGGRELTGGNRQNYMRAFLDLYNIRDLISGTFNISL